MCDLIVTSRGTLSREDNLKKYLALSLLVREPQASLLVRVKTFVATSTNPARRRSPDCPGDSRSCLDALLDMRDNAQLATHWMAEHTPESFEHNRKTFYAVTRCLEIISEASRSLPEELRDRHPEIPWRRMMDAGNVYRHQYDNVAEAFVWDTVHDDLAPLLTIVESELADITAFAT